MGVRILHAEDRNVFRTYAVLYCSTSDWAFGPVFYSDDEHDAEERAQAFLDWLPGDAREYSDSDLSLKYSQWLSQEADLWKQKEEVTEDE